MRSADNARDIGPSSLLQTAKPHHNPNKHDIGYQRFARLPQFDHGSTIEIQRFE
jgi:hypothetical protein